MVSGCCSGKLFTNMQIIMLLSYFSIYSSTNCNQGDTLAHLFSLGIICVWGSEWLEGRPWVFLLGACEDSWQSCKDRTQKQDHPYVCLSVYHMQHFVALIFAKVFKVDSCCVKHPLFLLSALVWQHLQHSIKSYTKMVTITQKSFQFLKAPI